MASGIVSSLLDLLLGSRNPPGSKGNPLEVEAVPGLMTLLDVALYRAVEGELTATVTSGHALLGKIEELVLYLLR